MRLPRLRLAMTSLCVIARGVSPEAISVPQSSLPSRLPRCARNDRGERARNDNEGAELSLIIWTGTTGCALSHERSKIIMTLVALQ